ncbi:hypothetical protein N5J77_08085 [Sphingobium yanoikuyae]|uniref:Uncharacterized protein n=1 Tax=Sphingobium yanoikuyae TaxID=13690 RepID=A0AA42WSN5_SPHYA|nr:hypothetical protein [Sphingobium yanoikuyae]MDH2131079.1 hypothetical protein [Sphingobium yanoikuyae]MDH2149181.1 hypothetical protein [Sphingobium yanoikuyae]MDH2166966.1 hypothetical protein [Sphingobium yanoikuyae]
MSNMLIGITIIIAALVDLLLIVTGPGEVKGAAPAQQRVVKAISKSRSSLAGRINVLDHGVKGIGCSHDDAPAIRLIFSGRIEGKTIFFPPGRIYCFKTNIPPGYPAFNRTSVLVSQKSKFNVIATGATFITHHSIPLTTTFTFDRASDWSWKGGSFIGSRAGLSPSAENVAIGLANVERFRVSDAAFTGYGGLGAAFAGDWIVSGEFVRLKMQGVGICFDLAFLKSVRIKDVVANGADSDGRSGAGQMGEKCFSTIQDGPLASHNRTSIAFRQTKDVTVENLDASNFRTGVAVASGKGYRFINNNIHDNPGGVTPGVGYYFYYINGGKFSSAGAPVSDVEIIGGKVSNNGPRSNGFGVLIDADTIANGDRMQDFSVSSVTFSNRTNIRTVGARLTGVGLSKNSFDGALQSSP